VKKPESQNAGTKNIVAAGGRRRQWRGLDAFIAAANKHKVWDREKRVNPSR
jgi:hypothetical protein